MQEDLDQEDPTRVCKKCKQKIEGGSSTKTARKLHSGPVLKHKPEASTGQTASLVRVTQLTAEQASVPVRSCKQ